MSETYSQRIKGVPVSEQDVWILLTDSRRVIEVEDHSLPPDAKLVNVYRDAARKCWIFLFEHWSFSEVQDGGEPPMFERASVEMGSTEYIKELVRKYLQRASARVYGKTEALEELILNWKRDMRQTITDDVEEFLDEGHAR